MASLRPLVLTTLLLGAVAGLYWWLALAPGLAQQAGGGPPGVVVEATQAVVATSVRKLKAVGTLASNQKVMVRPEIAGRLTKIAFEDGAAIEAGTLLVELDPSVLMAELASAKATLTLARQEYKRADQLLKRGTGTRQKKDQAIAELRAAEAGVALAQAQFDKTKILAPFEGTLGIRQVDVGAYLAAGADVVNLEQINPIKITFEVPERFIGELHVGALVQLRTDAYGGEIFPASITAVDPFINPRTRAAKVQARAANPDGRLKPGQFVSVTLRVNERKDAVFVPEQALVPNADEPSVFRIEGGVARQVVVRTGIRIARHIEILAGLRGGETVVTAGQLRLADGVPVTPRAPTFVPPSPPDEEFQVIEN